MDESPKLTPDTAWLCRKKVHSLISSMLQPFTKISFDLIQVFPFILRMIYFISATKPSKTFSPANKARTINNHRSLLLLKKPSECYIQAHGSEWLMPAALGLLPSLFSLGLPTSFAFVLCFQCTSMPEKGGINLS